MKIGQKIRNAREDKDILQRDMADLIPMNQSNYSKIERDIQEPSLYQLKRIVEILELDVSELLDIRPSSEVADLRFAQEVKRAYKKYFK